MGATTAHDDPGATPVDAPGAGAPAAPLLELRDLRTHFPVRSKFLRREVGRVYAVDGVDLTVARGETVGLVGESGCGKSTLVRTVIGVYKPTSGSIAFKGKDLVHASAREVHQLRRDMQLVFQNPYGSLNPRMKVGTIIAEPLLAYKIDDRAGIRRRVAEAMELVGLDPKVASRYPHEFSGGQRQRIGIARAIVLRPELLILDEPVSALDVSIQAQVLNVLRRLQRELGIACLIIAHDLAVVRHVADSVAVMYLGKIVELGANEEIYGAPSHPYTTSLLSAVPIPDPHARDADRVLLEGEIPSPMNPPSGCRFRTRCPIAAPDCADEEPALVPRPGVDHPCACHYAGERGPASRDVA